MNEAGNVRAPVSHRPQFDDPEHQHEASMLGMWVFLVTEVMFFGGLFAAYAVYRATYPESFAEGSRHLDLALGSVNTAILIASSLTMALAVRGAQVGSRKAQVGFLIATMVLGLGFLGIKCVEYHHELTSDVVHATEYVPIFVLVYFLMTGTHAIHMVAGVGVLAVMAVGAWRGRFGPRHHTPLEASGLYWHFVDCVWIFLFPLLYLLGAH